MTTLITYKRYIGELELDMEAGMIVGEVINIKDLLAFQGQTIAEATQSFRDAVDGYLAFCEKEHIESEKPFSGHIPFRTTPEIHRNMYMASRLEGKSINAWMNEVLAASAQRAVTGVEGSSVHLPGEPLSPQVAMEPAGVAASALGAQLVQSNLNKDVHVSIDETGNVVASIDSPLSRQSEKLALARAAARELSIPVKNVEVRYAETDPARIGHGIYGRLMMPVMVDAILHATRDLKERMKQIAAHTLEAKASDVTLENGKFMVAGSPSKSVSFREVAAAANTTNTFHSIARQGLESTVSYWEPGYDASSRPGSRKTASATSKNPATMQSGR